jgi:ubiquinone/menaquinone biosynthesis C-methylase UbiE
MGIKHLSTKLYMKLQKIVLPSFIYPQSIYESVLEIHVSPAVVWLDIGCGHQLLPSWRAAEEKRLIGKCQNIVGLDYSLESLKKHKNINNRVRGDVSKLPFKANTFDLVTANMVIEHLDRPEIQVNEIYRVLKPGGLFIFHTPNVYGYPTVLARLIPEKLKTKIAYILEGRQEDDIFPAYYRMNSERAIRHLAKMNGFLIQEFRMLVSVAKTNFIPPLAILELLLLRMLMTKSLRQFRVNIIAILKKEPSIVGGQSSTYNNADVSLQMPISREFLALIACPRCQDSVVL